jgi:hypothetical protein
VGSPAARPDQTHQTPPQAVRNGCHCRSYSASGDIRVLPTRSQVLGEQQEALQQPESGMRETEIGERGAGGEQPKLCSDLCMPKPGSAATCRAAGDM